MAWYTVTSPLSPPVRLDTGAIRVEALVPSGVQRYRTIGPDGNPVDITEYIPPEELGSQAYMDGLAGLPVLWREGRHPDTNQGTPDEGLVTIDDMGSATKLGAILGARMEGADQAMPLVIDHPDGEAIAREYPYVSMGYRADRVARPGVAPDGTPYTHIQLRRRQPNHVVLTHAPRAGYAAAVRLDAEDDPITPAQPDGDPMDPEMVAKIVAMLEALTAKVDALGAKETTEAVAEGEAMMDGAAPPRMDSLADVQAIQTAAADLGVALDLAKSIDDARKLVADKLAAGSASIRLDADADANARQLVISTYAASRPSQAERIARAGVTTTEGVRPRLTQ